MNRNVVVNSALALIVVAIVAGVILLERRTPSESLPPTEPTTTSVATTTTSTTTIPATTTTTSTTTSTTTTSIPPTTEVPLHRGLWKVIVVNGTSSGERLAPTIERLEGLGYTDVRGLVGAVKTTDTVIYYLLPGQESAADRLRVDLELPDATIAGFGDAPPVAGRNDAQLMIYLGGR